jgi:nucleoside-diphosphate-sugar epimerase
MKTLIIGGNRFVGLRLSLALDKAPDCDLHILNRTGQAAHVKNAAIYKGSRDNLAGTHIDKDWDVIYDFACYNYAQARESLDYFGKVGRYVHISTGSVYDDGRLQDESGFDPLAWRQHETPSEEEKKNMYQFGKRQCEAAFAQENKWPTLLVRLPFILGPDDYTRRLEFHIERIEKGLSIYFPDIEAHTSLCFSEDAARFLTQTLKDSFTGPVNIASPQDITLKSLVAQIERRVGRKAQLSPKETDENHSPYGNPASRSMDVSRAKKNGFVAKPLDAWLPDLIDSLASGEGSHLH